MKLKSLREILDRLIGEADSTMGGCTADQASQDIKSLIIKKLEGEKVKPDDGGNPFDVDWSDCQREYNQAIDRCIEMVGGM